jgi:hypothetical protein
MPAAGGTAARIETDVEAYAELAARLSASDDADARARLLSAHDLDEEGWDTLDDAWQARIAAEDDEASERGQVPALLARYAEAFARAQRAAASREPPLPFDRFVEATRELRRGVDMTTALDRLGIDLGTYLRAQQHWTALLVADAALAERFRDAMR